MQTYGTPMTDAAGKPYTAADYAAAKQEPVILAPQTVPNWRAPQFVWQVRQQVTDELCGAGAETCAQLETGGLQDHHDPRLAAPADRREVGQGGRDPAPHQGPQGLRQTDRRAL